MEEITNDLSNNMVQFQKFIINWTSENLKSYPWRDKKSPYKVLISEIFLIRTKAHQVKPIFIKFIEKYPSLESLFKMKLQDGEKLMNSLGLHKRVDMLKKLSEQIKFDFNEKIPNNYKDLISLMGIGPYTANAILCFAFGKRKPLLDNNILRLYERVFNIKSNKKKPTTDKKLWELSEKLLPVNNFVNFNYGILDFCIEICTPKKPKCLFCPLNQMCNHYKSKD